MVLFNCWSFGLLACLLSLVPCLSYAQIIPNDFSHFETYSNQGGCNSSTTKSAMATCLETYVAQYNPPPCDSSYGLIPNDNDSAQISFTCTDNIYTVHGICYTANYDFASNTCYTGTPPTQDDICAANAGDSVTYVTNEDSPPPSHVCLDSCQVQGNYYQQILGSGVNFPDAKWYMSGSYTGDSCSTAPPESIPSEDVVDPSPKDCGNGQINYSGFCYPVDSSGCPPNTRSGIFEGQEVCVPVSDQSVPPPDSSGSTGDLPSLGANTGSCSADFPDCGSGSGSDPGKCDPVFDDHCQAVAPPSASGSGSGECLSGHPDCGGSDSPLGRCDPTQDANCVASSVSGGICSKTLVVPPSCSGDAIQCAIAKQTFLTHCAIKQDSGGLPEGAFDNFEHFQQVGQSALDSNHDFGQFRQDVDVSGIFNGFDQSGFSQGYCPAPVTVQVFGNTLEFSYKPWCDFANIIRPLLIALATFLGAVICLRRLRA